MSIKKSQAILKCFIDLKNSVWFTLGSGDERENVGTATGNPDTLLANRKIRCIYPALANKIIRYICLPLFLCLYESFWTGFESDQRR